MAARIFPFFPAVSNASSLLVVWRMRTAQFFKIPAAVPPNPRRASVADLITLDSVESYHWLLRWPKIALSPP